ncbi:MAG: HEAT repeat domain-containing protein [Candidatus Hydrogenedentes bacterium]|nr:HEAT repeat domain-containing protein [Candidatus Hydrogenedentota bacterium]
MINEKVKSTRISRTFVECSLLAAMMAATLTPGKVAALVNESQELVDSAQDDREGQLSEEAVVSERRDRLLWTPLSPSREGAQTPLMAMALSADPGTRVRALEGASRVPAPELVPFVIYSLADPNEGVRERAMQTLPRLDSEAVTEAVVAVLAWGEPAVVAGVDAALPSLRSVLESGMLRMLDLPDRTRDERVALAYGLGRLGSRRSLESLTELALGDDSLVASYAANALASIDDPGSLHALARLVQHTDPNVRLPAYYGIARIGGPEALGLLTAAASVNGEPDRRVRREVVRFLGLVGDESTVHFLIGLVRERSGFVQPAIDALELITGMPDGLEGERWLEWYDELFGNPNVESTFTPPPLVPITDRAAIPGTPVPGVPALR